MAMRIAMHTWVPMSTLISINMSMQCAHVLWPGYKPVPHASMNGVYSYLHNRYYNIALQFYAAPRWDDESNEEVYSYGLYSYDQ